MVSLSLFKIYVRCAYSSQLWYTSWTSVEQKRIYHITNPLVFGSIPEFSALFSKLSVMIYMQLFSPQNVMFIIIRE